MINLEDLSKEEKKQYLKFILENSLEKSQLVFQILKLKHDIEERRLFWTLNFNLSQANNLVDVNYKMMMSKQFPDVKYTINTSILLDPTSLHNYIRVIFIFHNVSITDKTLMLEVQLV
jgi:hypothetical protein